MLLRAVIAQMRPQFDQRRRFCEGLQDCPGFRIETHAQHRERLIGRKTLTRGTSQIVSNGHRVHFVLGIGPWPGTLLVPGAGLYGKSLLKLSLSKNLIGFAGGSGGIALPLTGSTICGVTNTINSLLLRVTLLVLKK